ncbi:MAG: NusG domain II-containing protein [Clostridia bacterium]|nr:NusG domain II-containing protein [Clostridia bacterium]MBQ3870172.1 NusG domain II-containing protein [Clostridia bacterium]
MKKADVIPIAAVIAAAVIIALVFVPKQADTVRITCENAVYEYPIGENRRVELTENGVSLTVLIENGRVSVEKSTCRDQICVHTHTGSIICMPARVVITVEDGEYDHVAG